MSDIPFSAIVDCNSIHKEISGEINGLTAKSSPHGSDILVIEDSDASFAKKKILLSSLISGSFSGGYLQAALSGAPADEARWVFDGGANQLNDLTANSHNLTLAAGATSNMKAEGLVGLCFKTQERYTIGSPSNLRTAGALTWQFQLMRGISGATQVLATCGASGETQAANYLWQLVFAGTTTNIQYYAEYGSGTDISYLFPNVLPNNKFILTFTRDGSGNIKLYADDYLCGSASTTVPDGGSTGTPTLGSQIDTSACFTGLIYSARIALGTYSADDVANSVEAAWQG